MKNIGSFLLIGIIFILNIYMFFYFFIGNKKINNYIKFVIKQNFSNNKSNINKNKEQKKEIKMII